MKNIYKQAIELLALGMVGIGGCLFFIHGIGILSQILSVIIMAIGGLCYSGMKGSEVIGDGE